MVANEEKAKQIVFKIFQISEDEDYYHLKLILEGESADRLKKN